MEIEPNSDKLPVETTSREHVLWGDLAQYDIYVAHGTPLSSLPETCPDFLGRGM